MLPDLVRSSELQIIFRTLPGATRLEEQALAPHLVRAFSTLLKWCDQRSLREKKRTGQRKGSAGVISQLCIQYNDLKFAIAIAGGTDVLTGAEAARGWGQARSAPGQGLGVGERFKEIPRKHRLPHVALTMHLLPQVVLTKAITLNCKQL
jgi:hypothetical protein